MRRYFYVNIGRALCEIIRFGDGSVISAARWEKSEGFGLGSTRERASKIDEKCEIQTAAGHGTSIIVIVLISSFQLALIR